MSNAEILALVVAAASAVLSGSLGVNAYFAKDKLADVKKHGEQVASLSERLIKLEASSANARIDLLEPRVHAIELGLARIQSDTDFIKKWVQSQANQHRRFDDETPRN